MKLLHYTDLSAIFMSQLLSMMNALMSGERLMNDLQVKLHSLRYIKFTGPSISSPRSIKELTVTLGWSVNSRL